MVKPDVRGPKREWVREQVLKRILRLELKPDANINESRLAESLGVSRTPLREALLSLERDGFVRSEVNRGFLVAGLRLQEAREVYPILWALEGLALRESAGLAVTLVAGLERANRKLERAKRHAVRALEADRAFHDLLLSRCANQRLLGLIADQRLVLERFERIYMTDPSLIAQSVVQHRAIIEALRLGATDLAVLALEQNWRFALEAMTVRLSRAA